MTVFTRTIDGLVRSLQQASLRREFTPSTRRLIATGQHITSPNRFASRLRANRWQREDEVFCCAAAQLENEAAAF
jgi:hypothetical protein